MAYPSTMLTGRSNTHPFPGLEEPGDHPSAHDLSPRGIEVLFNRNRLNVAVSRAQTLAIVVGCPALVRTACTTIEQMRLVNLYCRAVQEDAPAVEAVVVGQS
jgi:hypothetical protein